MNNCDCYYCNKKVDDDENDEKFYLLNDSEKKNKKKIDELVNYSHFTWFINQIKVLDQKTIKFLNLNWPLLIIPQYNKKNFKKNIIILYNSNNQCEKFVLNFDNIIPEVKTKIKNWKKLKNISIRNRTKLTSDIGDYKISKNKIKKSSIIYDLKYNNEKKNMEIKFLKDSMRNIKENVFGDLKNYNFLGIKKNLDITYNKYIYINKKEFYNIWSINKKLFNFHLLFYINSIEFKVHRFLFKKQIHKKENSKIIENIKNYFKNFDLREDNPFLLKNDLNYYKNEDYKEYYTILTLCFKIYYFLKYVKNTYLFKTFIIYYIKLDNEIYLYDINFIELIDSKKEIYNFKSTEKIKIKIKKPPILKNNINIKNIYKNYFKNWKNNFLNKENFFKGKKEEINNLNNLSKRISLLKYKKNLRNNDIFLNINKSF